MLSQKVRQLLRPYSFLSHVVVACGVGLLLGVVSLWFSPLWTLAVLAAGGLILATLKRPELGLLGILVATSSIVFEARLPLIPIGIGSLHIPDVILLALLGLIGLRWLTEPDFEIIRTPLDVPLLAFYGVALLSTSIAILRSSVEFNIGLRGIRVVSYYLTFFVVTNLVREERQLVLLLRGLFLLATVVAAVMIAQFLVGEAVSLLPGRVETLSTQGTRYGGIIRILPPGISLIQVGFIATTAGLVLDKLKPVSLLRFLQWGLLGLALLLTFTRSYWVGAILALSLIAYLAGGRDRRRVAGWSLAIAFLVTTILLATAGQPESPIPRLVRAASERLATLASAETLQGQQSTFRWRGLEYGYALPQIASHPLLGMGLGTRYRPWDPRLDWQGPEDSGFDGRAYIHNGHVWILVKSGLLGYLCLVWLSLTFLFRGFKYWRRMPSSQTRAVVLGFTVTYLGVLVVSVTSPNLMEWFWTPVIGLMMGLNEAVLRLAWISPEQPFAGVSLHLEAQHEG